MRIFGQLADGRDVTEYVLRNRHGVSASILDYGGIIRTLEVPDRYGKAADVVLGFDELQGYEGEHPYFGAIVGRVAGRIDRGRLQLDDIEHQLSINAAPNHLHGGAIGFDHRLWIAEYDAPEQRLTLSYESGDGEEGYPGRLHARVVYELTDENELLVRYRATSDERTVVNLTQHSYLNLSGDPTQSVLDHALQVNAEQVLQLNAMSVPTGRVLDVAGSRFDFRQQKRIAAAGDEGLDHFWVLAIDTDSDRLRLAAQLCHEASGRTLQVFTSAPGVQIYTGNALPADLIGKHDVTCGPMSGVCLETQVHPDSPNHENFPDIEIGPHTPFESMTVFRFTST